MKTILVLGAGRSSGSLIRYLLDRTTSNDFQVAVAEMDVRLAQEKTANHPNSKAIALDIQNVEQRRSAIDESSLVISLLPPHLHLLAARECLSLGKHLITASYIGKELMAMDQEVSAKGLLFLGECGLDPGIDHMSAMEIIGRLKKQGANITSFRSYTGGLVAPEFVDNPWGYKFTWNPRNVILAGQGTARYMQDGKYRYIPYPRLFNESVRVHVPGHGRFDGYANRDSLAYREHYGLNSIPTLLRGTLRSEGFCSAWHVFVTLGLTDDSFTMESSGNMTYRDFVDAFLPAGTPGADIEEKIARFCRIDPEGPSMERIRSTGILEEVPIGLQMATPAQILQHLLQQKWVLKEGDLDMVVMQHEFEYSLNGSGKKLNSTLVVKGINNTETAMARTVGLPLGIVALELLNGKISQRGVHLPLTEDIFTPVLAGLSQAGISFTETEG